MDHLTSNFEGRRTLPASCVARTLAAAVTAALDHVFSTEEGEPRRRSRSFSLPFSKRRGVAAMRRDAELSQQRPGISPVVLDTEPNLVRHTTAELSCLTERARARAPIPTLTHTVQRYHRAPPIRRPPERMRSFIQDRKVRDGTPSELDAASLVPERTTPCCRRGTG